MLRLYLDLAKKNPHWEVIKCVDGKGKLYSIDQVHKKVVAALKKHEIV